MSAWSTWIFVFQGRVKRLALWLAPGLGVKRWLIPILLGTTMLSVGFAILVLDIYRSAPDTWWLPLLSAASLRSLDRGLRALVFGALGAGLVVWGIWSLSRALMAPYRLRGGGVLNELAQYRRLERGPRLVALGGGHGLSMLLRGLKTFSYNITAIVTVADDGGSSGKLRRSLGVLPPGDIRNCLAALSSDEALLTKLFQYRFPAGESGLDGHSFGNLFITALAEITGSFEQAVSEAGKVLTVRGRVLPATLHDVRLVADMELPEMAHEVRVEGESRIPEFPGRVRRLWLEPGNPPPYPPVIQALLAADVIVVGPGSLYTSILPTLLVPDIVAAIEASRAFKVFVCNVATQPGETDGFSVADHLEAIREHVGTHLFDVALVNNRCQGQLNPGVEWVCFDRENTPYHVFEADLVEESRPWRHDSKKLAEIILNLYQERTGPLVEYPIVKNSAN